MKVRRKARQRAQARRTIEHERKGEERREVVADTGKREG